MAVYLTELVGTGKRLDPFRSPVEGALIDLRPDSSVKDGYALVATDDNRQLRSRKIGDSPHDSLSVRTRNRVHNRMGVDVSRTRSLDVLIATLMTRPNGWNPIRPVLSRWRYEIWLGELVWTFPLLSGGASDNFNRANETPIAAPWSRLTGSTGNINLVSNAVVGSADGDKLYSYTGAATTANQYSQGAGVSSAIGDWGPAVRISSLGTFDCYLLSAGQQAISKIVNTTFSNVQSLPNYNATTFPGDVIRVEVEGSTLRAIKVGTGQYTNSPTSDVSLAAGGLGVGMFEFETVVTIDNWAGGDFPEASSGRPSFRHAPGTGLW